MIFLFCAGGGGKRGETCNETLFREVDKPLHEQPRIGLETRITIALDIRSEAVEKMGDGSALRRV